MGAVGGKAELAAFVPLWRIVSMDKFDIKLRIFLVDEGYLFPITDAEIERALKESEAMQTETVVGEDLKLGILHSRRGYWVSNEGTKENPSFHVWIPGITHSTVDSAYSDLSLAIARCDYLAFNRAWAANDSKKIIRTTFRNTRTFVKISDNGKYGKNGKTKPGMCTGFDTAMD